MRDVDADPVAFQFLCGVQRGAATAEGIEYDIAYVAGGNDDAFEQGNRLLSGIAEHFRAEIYHASNISPYIANRDTWSVFQKYF